MVSSIWVRVLIVLRTFLIAALLALLLFGRQLPPMFEIVGIVLLLLLSVGMFVLAKKKCGCPHCGITGAKLEYKWACDSSITCPGCKETIYYD